MEKKDNKKGNLRTTVTIPSSVVPELMKITEEVRRKLPPELSRKVSPAFVIAMIVRSWIEFYKDGKITVEKLMEVKDNE